MKKSLGAAFYRQGIFHQSARRDAYTAQNNTTLVSCAKGMVDNWMNFHFVPDAHENMANLSPARHDGAPSIVVRLRS